ncbi:MAG: hypothetical protein FD131_3343 [Rhodocyclaceae bacterium]|nr:MAG: hypothetical protein FD131_3343 [Rhodocyclaceae bacterium]
MNRPTPQLIKMKKWMRKSTVNFFERNPDVIGAPSFVPICNKMIADVLSSGFEVVTRDTHFITCRSRQILSQNLTGDIFQEDEIFKAESAMNAHFERLHDYFDTRIQQGEQKLELGGFGSSEIQKLVTNYETMTVTNGVTQYLDILAKADHYITILQYLWVTSELSDNPDEAMRVKLNTEREVRHHLFGITRASNTHYNNIRRICNGVVERRRQERANQAERDRQRAAERKIKAEQAEARRQAESQQRKDERRQRRDTERAQNLAAAQNELNSLAPEATPA